MEKEKAYEYHKQNDYPGERVAERKRVADRAEAAGKRCDVRVAEKGRTESLKADNRVAKKGRMDDALMDAEVERSTEKAGRVSRARNAANAFGLLILACVLVLLLAGVSWGYTVLQQQSDEIDYLNSQIIESDNAQTALTQTCNDAQLSNANKQIQLYRDFLVLIADVKEEVRGLEQYKGLYSNNYQLCANFMERENNINHALNRFAEKELVYYEQIAVLADKPRCKAKIAVLNQAMASSKAADEKLYIQAINQCNRLMSNPIGESKTLRAEYEAAVSDATAKAKAFTNAEKELIACFA